MNVRDRLLKRGYFPSGLPPLFTTSKFAEAVTSSSDLPQAFVQKNPEETIANQYSLARSGGLRRRLTVVNPVNFFRLATAIEVHKTALVKEWRRSPYSLTKPSAAVTNERALGPRKRLRAIENAQRRVGQRVIVKTDVSDFYPSVYTHAISWALDGGQRCPRAGPLPNGWLVTCA